MPSENFGVHVSWWNIPGAGYPLLDWPSHLASNESSKPYNQPPPALIQLWRRSSYVVFPDYTATPDMKMWCIIFPAVPSVTSVFARWRRRRGAAGSCAAWTQLLVLCYFLCFVKAWEIIEDRLSNHWEELEFTQQSLNDRHSPNEQPKFSRPFLTLSPSSLSLVNVLSIDIGWSLRKYWIAPITLCQSLQISEQQKGNYQTWTYQSKVYTILTDLVRKVR